MLKLNRRLRILDLDGSITDTQTGVMARVGSARAFTVPARDLGPRIRYLATRGAMRTLAARLAAADRDCLTLFGSGDFHHVSAALLGRFPAEASLTVVVFDRHPDGDRRSPWPCCGSWILEALRMPQVQAVVVIGLGSHDIAGWRVTVGPVRALRSGKASFYPFDCPPSYAFVGGGLPAELPCASFAVGPLPLSAEIRWHNLAADLAPNDWNGRMRRIVATIPTRDIYLSIDKDCLTPDAALTNWEPGHLPLANVLAGIGILAGERDIVGADITGEYSSAEIASPYFRRLYAADRPASAPGHPGSDMPEPDRATLRRNEETNHSLLSVLGF